jgi:hypothetical protein
MPYKMDISVTERRRFNIVGTLFEVIGGIILLAVIVAVLLIGTGAVIVHLGTTEGLPAEVVKLSVDFYRYFF